MAQLELMICDQPCIVSRKDNDDDDITHSKKEMDSLSDRWHAMRKGKSMVGETISLGDYLRSTTGPSPSLP